MLVLSWSLGFGESTEEFSELINFCKLKGLALNNDDVSIVTDRAPAISAAISASMELAYHTFCLKHLEWNVNQNIKSKNEYDMKLFKDAAFAKTEVEYITAMEELRTKNEAMYTYLVGIDKWQRYKLYQR